MRASATSRWRTKASAQSCSVSRRASPRVRALPTSEVSSARRARSSRAVCAPAALAAHLGVPQLPLDGRDQPPEIALGEEILRTRLHRLDRDVLADRAGDENERGIGIARAQQGEGRRPAERRHAVVADHEIPGMTVEGGRHGGWGVDSLECRLVARLLQLPQQQSGVVFGVFRDQHPQRDAHRLAPWWRTGFM